MDVAAEPLLACAAPGGEQGGSGPRLNAAASTDLWSKARVKVIHAVRVKHKLVNLHTLARDTALMRNLKSEQERQRYVLIIMTLIVVLGAVTAMTKSAIFHMSAVGRWGNGHPYKFSYALSLTLVVFVLKVFVMFVRSGADEAEAEDEAPKRGDVRGAHEVHRGAEWQPDKEDLPESLSAWVMPWVLLVTFTGFEMLSATVASLGLLYGAPTSVFLVFKSSKTIFLAVLSVLVLGSRLNAAQWTSLVLISVSLGLAALAEGDADDGTAQLSFIGPALLLLSELFHAFMLVLQEVAVREYWPDPLVLLSASAVIGVVMTLAAMHGVSQVFVDLPDGGRRPASDAVDSVLMCVQNPLLGLTMVLHLGAHVSSDVSHLVILKHISALARTLCDAVKLILMWLCGKAFWALGVLPVLAEAWRPGLVGSWLMLPAILIIIYAMLMFKDASFLPLKPVKAGGRWGLQESKVTREGERAQVKVNLEDPFYVAMFRSRKVLQLERAHSDPMGRLVRAVTRKDRSFR